MAPPKKRKKKKGPGFRLGAAHRQVNSIDASIPATIDHKADIEVTNDSCTCLSAILAAGFDPYVSINLWPTQELFATKPVYNAKRAVRFTAKENNVMKWIIDRSLLLESVLSIGVYDEEVGADLQIGHSFVKVDKYVQTYKDDEEFEIVIKRAGRFSGTVDMRLAIGKADQASELIIQVEVLAANHLKKQRDTDVATDQSTMFYVVVGFFSFICIFGALFQLIEKPEEGEEIASSRITTFWDGFWFVFITATTVGFGDKFPWTPLGRFINSIVICFDVLFIGFALGLIVDFIAASAERANTRMKEDTFDEAAEYKKFLRELNQRTVGIAGNEHNATPDGGDDLKSKEDVSPEEVQARDLKRLHRMFIRDLIVHIGLVALLIVLGSIFFYYEQKSTDSPWSYAQSLHFCFVTMSTVGYGDIAPTRQRTQIVCVFYILFGVGLLVRLGGLVVDKLSEQQQRKLAQMRADETLMHWEQITEFDQDGDGELDLDEYCRAMLRSTGKVSEYDFEQIDARFDLIDTDNNGFITKEDFLDMQKRKRSSTDFTSSKV